MTRGMTNLDADVLIVGGGPVGTLLAAEVALGGASVLVIERDLEPSDTIKAGSINLASAEILARRGLIDGARRSQERAMESYAELLAGSDAAQDRAAALERLRRQTPRATHFAGIMLDAQLVDPDDLDIAQHREALDATLIAQREIQRLLDEYAARLGVPIRRGITVTAMHERENSVEIETDQGTLRAQWVVGCDGGRSAIRHAAGFDFPGTDPEITGRQATVDFADGQDKVLDTGWHWTSRGVYRHGPRPGIVLTVEFDGPPADRDRPVSAEEIQDSLRRVSGIEVTVTGLRGQATRWTDNARQATSYRQGRVLLAGDAAHVHSPFSGQGLNLGLGDAMNLGWKLAATVHGSAPEGLLDTYSAERHPLGAWVLDWTRAQVALMRPDEKTGHLRDVVTDLLGTSNALTHMVNLVSGVTQRVEIPGEHPLVGRLVPDLTTRDGRSLRERFATGRFVLLDRTADALATAAAAGWGDRVVIVEEGDAATAPAALLVRPDGVIAWAAEPGIVNLDALKSALRRWIGSPDRAADRTRVTGGRS